MKKNTKRKNEGITLIALVITIIVLLILAGVTIATLTGDNGILTKAQNAKNQTEEAEDIEKIRLAISETQIGENGYQEIDAINFEETLNNQFEGRNLQLSDNGDGSFIINLDNMSKMYYVDNEENIISKKNMLEISTAEELKLFRDNVNSGNTYENWYIYLTNNINLDVSEIWEPIGIHKLRTGEIEHKPFKGIFDGKGFQVDYIKIDSLGYTGLFGFVENSIIKNVGIGEHCDMTSCGDGIHIGAIVGFLYDNSTIKNCYNLSSISGNSAYEIGGIVGTTNINCKIYNCFNKGNVISNGTDAENPTVGGIVGNLISGEVRNCYNIGNLKFARRRWNCWNSTKKFYYS